MSTFTVRLPSAISGVLLILTVFLFLTTFVSRTAGAIGALTLLATPHLFIPGPGHFFSTHTLRSADSDGLFILLSTLSLAALTKAAYRSHAALIAGFVLSGLAVLTKGPLGLLPAAAFCIFAAVRNLPVPRRQLAAAGAVLAAVIFPWHIAMTARYGSRFTDTYIGYHILERFIMPLEGHVHGWWYYLQVLASPAVFPALPVFIIAVAVLAGTRKSNMTPEIFLPGAYLMLTFGITLAARTRLAWYLLPVYPPVAILTGCAFGGKRFVHRHTVPAAAVLVMLSVIALSVTAAVLTG